MEVFDKQRGCVMDEQEENALLWSMLPDDDVRVRDDEAA